MWIRWAAVMLAWLLGVALQLQRAEIGSGRLGLVVLAAMAGAGLVARWMRGRAFSPAWTMAGWCLLAMTGGWAVTEWRAGLRLAQTWPGSLQGRTVILTARVDGLPQVQPWGTRVPVEILSVEHDVRRWAPGDRWRLHDASPTQVCPQRLTLSWRERKASIPGRVASAHSPARTSGPTSAQPTTQPPAQPSVLRPGDVWRWPVHVLPATGGAANPGGFDAALWLFEQGLRGQARVVTAEDAPQPLKVREGGWLTRGAIDRLRWTWRGRIEAAVPDRRVAGILIGLTIGEQSAIGQDDWDVLRQTGTAHLAAISGLHITMMGWLSGGLAGWCWRRSGRLMQAVPAPVAAGWAGVAGAAAYALAAGWGVPAQRTVLMLAVVTLLRLSSRRWPWPLVLLLAAVAVTVQDPWCLLQAGFWLSFTAVGLLMLSTRPRAAGRVPPTWRVRVWEGARNFLRAQLVAAVGLAPLSLIFFQQVSLVGVVANLLAIPVCTLLITPLALMGLVASPLWDLAAPVVSAGMRGLGVMAQWPMASFHGAAVVPWAAALALVGAAGLIAPLPPRVRLAALVAVLPLLAPPSCAQRWPAPPKGQMEVLAVDIGQGTAVVLRTARHALLYDTGPRTSPENDAGRRILVGLLHALGVGRLDLLVISHGDSDHVGGASSVMRGMAVSALSSSLEGGHALLSQPDRRGAVPPHRGCLAGQTWSWDGVHFEVLHPAGDDHEARLRGERSDNGMSCVLRVQTGAGHSILLTGDVEAPEEALLRQRHGARLKTEVLMAPHHGSRTSSTPGFLAAVQPEVAVVQAGARNAYGHPHPTVMRRYRDLGVHVVATPTCGAWRWLTAHGAARLVGRCWQDERRRYWHPLPTGPGHP